MSEQLAAHRSTDARSVAEVLQDVDRQLRTSTAKDVRTVPTGFEVLDDILAGGLHAGDLVLLGGPPGVGKTIAALQMARNVARGGHRAVFVCYEHDPTTLLVRLLALEAGDVGGDHTLSRTVARVLSEGEAEGRSLGSLLADTAAGAQALERLQAHADDLILVRASGSHTTTDDVARSLAPHVSDAQRSVLFVDYLQKVPLHPEPATEAEKVTRTVEALKDLALAHHVPVVLLSAVDAEGMRANRIRMHHLRGSSAIAFESDVVLMLNDKQKAVSKVHLSYDPVRARTFADFVVWSIEKNRGGPNLIDLEFRKDFTHFRFDPAGGMVTEQLVSERLDEVEL